MLISKCIPFILFLLHLALVSYWQFRTSTKPVGPLDCCSAFSSTVLNRWFNNTELWSVQKALFQALTPGYCRGISIVKGSPFLNLPGPAGSNLPHSTRLPLLSFAVGMASLWPVESYGQNNPFCSHQMKSPPKIPPCVSGISHFSLSLLGNNRCMHVCTSSGTCLGVIPSLT